MSIDSQKLRLDGIYPQKQNDYYFQRIKLSAGVISSIQARQVAEIANRFGRGTIHLTTRGNLEIHWLTVADLPGVGREMAKAGLTARGACGGAVRCIACGSHGSPWFPVLESLSRRLHRHFTGNPHFEGLPKKFKIGIEADLARGRHLIQDVGLVLAGKGENGAIFDLWIAGGLGREPRPGFLLAGGLPEGRIIPVIESVIRVYAKHAPPQKRLKFLASELGEDKLRLLIESDPGYYEELPNAGGFDGIMTPDTGVSDCLKLPLFAGNLTSAQFASIADAADRYAGGALLISTDQDILLYLNPGVDPDRVRSEINELTGLMDGLMAGETLRVCPGNHECLMGLAPTRDIASDLHNLFAGGARLVEFAISGCPNSCTQPQLAAVGIVASRLFTGDDGIKAPRFDLFLRQGLGFGEKIREALTREELLDVVSTLSSCSKGSMQQR